MYATTKKWFKDRFLVDIMLHQKSIKSSKDRTIQEKKARFRALFVPALKRVHQELMEDYSSLSQAIADGKDRDRIKALKRQYRATSDSDLLARLKPHPISIALAQAALESSWGTSRFFIEANNPFGMWSSDPNEPRIAAGVQRDGNRTIWLRKFTTLDDAIRAYYKTIAVGKSYRNFRDLRMNYDDPYRITEGLDKYSEIGKTYVKEINKVIRYNKFTIYDQNVSLKEK